MASGTPVVYQQGTSSQTATGAGWAALRWIKPATSLLATASPTARVSCLQFGLPFVNRAMRLVPSATKALFSMAEVRNKHASPLGDYSSISVDPVDDCTLWYTTEYIPSNGSFNWNTRIANFKFSTCGGSTGNTPPAASFTYSCTGLADVYRTSTDPADRLTVGAGILVTAATSILQSPSHTFATGGTYSVGLRLQIMWFD